MKNTRIYNYQNLLSKWLLAAVLLLSFFSVSGFVIQTQQKPCAPQTTWVQTRQNRLAKSITYKRALSHTHNRLNSPSFFILSSINLSAMHSRQLKVQMTDRCNPDIPGLSTLLFYQHKTIPQNTSDDPAIALV
jgi:hypothetical protein